LDHPKKILFYAYGNPGRHDDGLGNAFVNSMEKWVKDQNLTGIDFDSNYQLNIEDAEIISHYDMVIFVDASIEDIEVFCISLITPKSEVSFTTHAANPAYIVQLCRDIFQKNPASYLLHIKGYEWDFVERLSPQAEKNLMAACKLFQRILKSPENIENFIEAECLHE
jgi:hydrogenase maturation protease